MVLIGIKEMLLNVKKHGVSLYEIEALFNNKPRILLNQNHNSDEVRYHAVGDSGIGRYIFVVFTIRKELIRVISARYMHQKEIENYERQN